MDVNTLASKRFELIGNAEILRMRGAYSTTIRPVCACVFQLPRLRRDASFDLWPAVPVTMIDCACPFNIIWGHDMGHTDTHTNKPPRAGAQLVVHTSIIITHLNGSTRQSEFARVLSPVLVTSSWCGF